ncbi:hypothetical protein P22_3560 [Propionispora sp. 2/2-37]|uniref:M24 family metallopeptidase n=1 Tax=Propionispora sp. 2/2-37 TaxID=1677858 RepID=UPI0006C42D58|nr:Xaa-Pro peptidase family protein [Propionispora sp. 2/2-37]CUH97430.1 hypothetical protein P22_3560 [Propionispora sp. 2/2-37]
MQPRIRRLRDFMANHGLDGFLVSKPENRRYFSGFTGSAGVLFITENQAKLLTDFRYMEQATDQAGDQYDIIRYGGSTDNSLYKVVSGLVAHHKLCKVGFEGDFTTFQIYSSLIREVPGCLFESAQLDGLRVVKDERELGLIRKAVNIADQAFTHILSVIKPGISEYDVALELEYKMRRLGAEKPAFDTIVASGLRGALPHATPLSDKLLAEGEFITMDFGAVYQGYHSDITRTVVLGCANKKQKKLYDLVLSAQTAGVAAVASGKVCRDVDKVARNIISDAGYGEFFGHGLGHGVGLAIHEEPRLTVSSEDVVLKENMVVTVEPGIYLPGWGGLRIEDTVVVCAGGSEILTASSKQLIEIQ